MDIIIVGIIVAVAMFFFIQDNEYSYKDKEHVYNYLPWAYLVQNEEGIVINKNGSIQMTFRIKGQDSTELEQITQIKMRSSINNAFKRLKGNWSIHVDSRRIETQKCVKSSFSSKILQKIDDIRIERYNSGKYLETETYLTFCWLPPADLLNKLSSKFITDELVEEEEANRLKHIENFKMDVKEYVALLKNVFKEITPLNDEETLTFLHSSFSQNINQKIVPLRKDIMLDAYLSDTPITRGLTPKIGDEYLGAIGILAFPNETFPSMFEEINNLGIPLRWSSRFIVLDKDDAITLATRIKGKWSNKRKDFLSAVEDKAMEQDRGATNYEALSGEEDGENMLNNLQNDVFSLGYYTFSVLITDKTIAGLNDKLDEVISIIQKRGFVAIKEHVNLLESFFGSMPGDVYYNVRKVPLPSLSVIDLMQFTSAYDGEKINKHLNACPLIYAKISNTQNIANFNLHVGDVGHTAMYGVTGAGKSVFLNLLECQFKKYKNSQVFIFDKGGSSRVVTTAINGKFYDLGKDDSSFQPLAKIGISEAYISKEKCKIDKLNISKDEIDKKYNEIEIKEKNRASREKDWAFEWLCDIFKQENIEMTPEMKLSLQTALNSVANLPENLRTISQLAIQLQNPILRAAIENYTNDGSLGKYFDSSSDSFTSEFDWQVFEMDGIFSSKLACSALLKYIFHKLEVEMFDPDKTTLLVIDEAWKIFDDPEFSAKFREWLKELRKKNVSVVFATQEIKDTLSSSIKDTLLASCKTTIFLANEKALTKDYIEIYKDLGLNMKQIEILANLEQKRDYYVFNELGAFSINLELNDFELAFPGATGAADQKQAIKIKEELEKLSISKEDWEKEFYERWKEYKNLKEVI